MSVADDDYQRILAWGADWFRYETFGAERTTTDVVGLLDAPVEVPCLPGRRDCFRRESSKTYFVRAIDDLDGVRGNLYTGNGGFQGSGYTPDLVIRFPAGTRLYGLPLPEEVHTGLDVEAGSAWPIGIAAVPAEGDDASLPYVWDLASLGVGPAPSAGKVRIGITCALCHYSLDIDWDGHPDLRSARTDQPTPGSQYRPEHAWAVGNQNLKVGWLFALSKNPLMGFAIFSGPIGTRDADSALRWTTWVKDNYKIAPEAVAREVARGMLLQPRGYADVTSNARYNASQFPPLYTQHNWPSNSDGAVLNGTDRNNVVWTSTLDFSGAIGLAHDRGGGGAGVLFWEDRTIYDLFSSVELADLMVYLSPAGAFDARRRAALRDDILGASDGVPGLLDPESVYVMQGPAGVIPADILNHPENRKAGRIRVPEDFGTDAVARGPMLALLGVRVHVRPKLAAAIHLDEMLVRYPRLRRDDLMGEAVNAVLDWQPSPPNLSRRLARASDRVARGYGLFKSQGCASCHGGPYFTDDVIHRVSARREREIGIASPSTAGFRSLGRGTGPAIDSDPERTWDSRKLYLYVAPGYDPRTGLATGPGGPLRGLFGDQVIGYKSTPLRYLWGSPPYLHDGGVGVAIAPGSRVDRDDLAAVLKLPSSEKIYGMGAILAHQEANPSEMLRADAALSLQALLLRGEREEMLRHKDDEVVPVPGVGASENPLRAPPFVSASQLGIEGVGHEFFLDDERGGEHLTDLVAFLLALDDAPGDLPKRKE